MKILSLREPNKKKFGLLLFVYMFLLLGLGCVFVYSASFYSAEITYSDKFFFLKKQFLGIGVGFVGFVFFSFWDYHNLIKFRFPLLAVSYVLLVLVFVPGVGLTNYGATRWLNLRFITFQPSEIAKFAFIVFSSSYLSKSSEKVASFKGLLPVLIVGVIFCALIIVEPNMSITICMALLMVSMLFLGGARIKHFAMLAGPALAVAVMLVLIEPYRMKRLIAFIDPFASSKGEGFQLVQSLLGIALGGAFGTGIFKSRQKYLFLPFSESDFIFSVIAEESGFVGALFVILLFLLIFFAIVNIAHNAKDKFGFLLASGIGMLILIQVMLNLAVVTGLVPPTGLPLPFISAGSTSIMVFMSMIGVVMNVAKQSK